MLKHTRRPQPILTIIVAAMLTMLAPAQSGAIASMCSDVFDRRVRYFDTQDLREEYRGEENGRFVMLEAIDVPSQRLFFRTTYLSSEDARPYRVFFLAGRWVNQRGELIDTADFPGDSALFVMNEYGEIFVGAGRDHSFHHSSFVAGGRVAAAGEVVIRNGRLVSMNHRSGHYRPTLAQTRQFLNELRRRGVRVDQRIALSFEGVPEREEF